MNKLFLTGLLGMLLPLLTQAAEVTVSDAWARATAPGQDSAAIQCVLNSSQDARLIGISSPVAGGAELHRMMQMNGMMMMHAVESLNLKAGKSLNLSAEGYHLMLLNLKQGLKAGEAVPFTLIVQFADKHKEKIEARAEVRPLTSSAQEHHHHH